jgi:DNA invertase Pin-like site-specific DNA recombinase
MMIAMPGLRPLNRSPEAQIRDLEAAGAEKLFRENVSSVAPRKQPEAAFEFAREGDTLVITKIDRLARSVRHLCDIVDRLQAKLRLEQL